MNVAKRCCFIFINLSSVLLLNVKNIDQSIILGNRMTVKSFARTLRDLKIGDYFNLLHPAVNKHQYVIYYAKQVKRFSNLIQSALRSAHVEKGT